MSFSLRPCPTCSSVRRIRVVFSSSEGEDLTELSDLKHSPCVSDVFVCRTLARSSLHLPSASPQTCSPDTCSLPLHLRIAWHHRRRGRQTELLLPLCAVLCLQVFVFATERCCADAHAGSSLFCSVLNLFFLMLARAFVGYFVGK